jgi:hypothetical protein
MSSNWNRSRSLNTVKQAIYCKARSGGARGRGVGGRAEGGRERIEKWGRAPPQKREQVRLRVVGRVRVHRGAWSGGR